MSRLDRFLFRVLSHPAAPLVAAALFLFAHVLTA
jgi:hypothetical protein